MNNLLYYFTFIITGLIVIYSCSSEENDDSLQSNEIEIIKLKLKVHLIQTSPWVHNSGVELSTWVTVNNFKQTIITELNTIWKQANIKWAIDSIPEEPIFETDNLQEKINYVLESNRDGPFPDRLTYLEDFTQPGSRIEKDEDGSFFFHVYLFPFTGNTRQGTAIRWRNNNEISFLETFIGTWSNKHNNGGVPEKCLLIEDQNEFVRGSLSRTIAHELGHLLTLQHDLCSPCLMKGGGYYAD